MSYNPTTTSSSGMSAGMQQFCDRIKLKYAEPNLVHAQGAVPKNIPKKSGKVAQWRRLTPLSTLENSPLSEAVIPDGQTKSEEEVLAYVYQWGGYVTNSDLFDLTHMDANLRDDIKLMLNQGTRTQDAIIRDAMATTTTIQYANSKTAIYSLLTTDEMNVDEIRKMVRTLKKNNTPRFMRGGMGYYMSVIGPDAVYDIQSDTKWLSPKEYKDTKDIYNGEVGMVYGVRFLETTECKKYDNPYLSGTQKYVTVASWNAGTDTATIDEALTTAEAAALVGLYVNMLDATDGTTYERALISGAAAGAAGAATITLDATPTMTPDDDDIWYANTYGYTSNSVYATFVFGDDAYATADINGSGKIKTIIHTADEIGGPLNQFGTVGWKIAAFAVKVLQPLWIGQILHGATA